MFIYFFFGSELWVPNKISSRIQSTEMTFFREAKGCKKLDNIRNEYIRNQLEIILKFIIIFANSFFLRYKIAYLLFICCFLSTSLKPIILYVEDNNRNYVEFREIFQFTVNIYLVPMETSSIVSLEKRKITHCRDNPS